MKFLGLSLVVAIQMISALPSISEAGECKNWKIHSAKFQMNEALNATHDFQEGGLTHSYGEDFNVLLETPWTTKILKGDLVVLKKCINSDDSSLSYERKELRIPLAAAMRLRGANLRWLANYWHPNTTMTIHGLEGKTVKDFLRHWYGGFKAGASLAFVAVNANAMGAVLFNPQNGITIGDLEKPVTLGYTLGIGFNISWISLQFSLLADYNQTYSTSTNHGTGKETQERQSLETQKIRNMKF